MCLFVDVAGGELWLNPHGHIVAQTCEWLVERYTYVKLDQYIIMPNHFHGILRIIESDNLCSRGGLRPAPTEKTRTKPLGQLIGLLKTCSTKKINLLRATQGLHIWQRNYYEHIIRDEIELDKFSTYILSNLQTWTDDPENIV